MPTFEESFRAHVVPDLRRMCEAWGVRLAWEDGEFTEAITAIEAEARKRGADSLPGFRRPRLNDWIARTLLAEIDRNIPEAAAGLDQIDRSASEWVPKLQRAADFDEWLKGYLEAAGCQTK